MEVEILLIWAMDDLDDGKLTFICQKGKTEVRFCGI